MLKNNQLCQHKMEEAGVDPMIPINMSEFLFTTKQDRDYAIEVFIFKCGINEEAEDASYSVKGEEVVKSWSETPPHLCHHLEDCRRYY